MLYNKKKKQSSKYSWQSLVSVSSSAICISPPRRAHSKWMFWQRSQTHMPLSHKQLTVTPLLLMRATAAVLQHLFLYAILLYVPYVLSCLPQPDGELLTPGETRKGEMGNCRLPHEEEVALARKTMGRAASSDWAGVAGAGTQIGPQLEEGRLAAPTAQD